MSVCNIKILNLYEFNGTLIFLIITNFNCLTRDCLFQLISEIGWINFNGNFTGNIRCRYYRKNK